MVTDTLFLFSRAIPLRSLNHTFRRGYGISISLLYKQDPRLSRLPVLHESFAIAVTLRFSLLIQFADVSVSYETDVDFAIKTLQKAFDDSRASMPNVLEGPTILGVSKLDESGVNLRVYAMAKADGSTGRPRETSICL